MSNGTVGTVTANDLVLIQRIADEHTRFATAQLEQTIGDLRSVGITEQLIGATAVHLGLVSLVRVFGREEVQRMLEALGPLVAEGAVGGE